MGLLDKFNALSTGAKVGIASGAALVAAAGVGLGITQPWNQQNQLPVDDTPPVQQTVPQETVKQNEHPLSVRAGNDVVNCTLYEGDGWSIYVPEGWSPMDAGENEAGFTSGKGGRFVVTFPTDNNDAPGFVCLSDEGKEYALQFYRGGGNSPYIMGYGPRDSWDYCSKLFTALARTLTVGDQSPFGEVYIIPQPADWQKAEGLTVLFLDKDGYVVDEKMRDAVESYMMSWSDEERAFYTGQYRINDIQWAACYTGITEEGYIDVFQADVQYRVASGAETRIEEQDNGVSVVDGWASRNLYGMFLAIFHDGGSVERTLEVVTADVRDWAAFAALLK